MTNTDRPSWRVWARRAAWAVFYVAAGLALLFFATLAFVIGIGPP